MKPDAMKEALHRRKGMGVDITLIIGQPKAEEKPGDTEMAPEVKDAPESDMEKAKQHAQMDQSLMGPPNMKQETPHGDEEQDRALIEKMMATHELQEGDQYDNSTIKGKARNAMLNKFKK